MEDAGIDAVRQVNPGLKRRKLNTNLHLHPRATDAGFQSFSAVEPVRRAVID
jgi:hypothetical protein